MKQAILILAYGAPDTLADVEAFYTDIRRGNPPPPELLEELLGRYRAIGGKSPLLDITQRQAQALETRLGNGIMTYVGMRHWSPWIADTVRKMADDGIEEAVAIVMAPHYSSMSISKYRQIVEAANDALGQPVRFHFV
ncbi:MAG: ferrochelatase, partial [Verrucomicrobia bacterium]|nr:ferrochelatase [Verrucomicrobiota bacterium]